jgi:hypothetical protein
MIPRERLLEMAESTGMPPEMVLDVFRDELLKLAAMIENEVIERVGTSLELHGNPNYWRAAEYVRAMKDGGGA